MDTLIYEKQKTSTENFQKPTKVTAEISNYKNLKMFTKVAILFSTLVLLNILLGCRAVSLSSLNRVIGEESYDYEEENEYPEDANYQIADENSDKYSNSFKSKREMASPQEIANDLVDNYNGMERLQEEEQNSYNKILNQLKQKFYDGGEYAMSPNSNSTKQLNESITNFVQPKINLTDQSDCGKVIDPTNATSVLERILEELENIRLLKQGNNTPEGTPCDLEASWNSEIIGLRFQFNVSNNNVMNVVLSDKIPQRHTYKIDKTWNCTGFSLNRIGGPFYLTCLKKPQTVLALFTGICKNCGGYNTIFGSWTFAHHPSDCQNLHTFIENKNDVFRHEVLHLKKIQKDQKAVIQQPNGKAGNKTRRYAKLYKNYDFD